jgi:hypothetical protein
MWFFYAFFYRIVKNESEKFRAIFEPLIALKGFK